MVALSGEERDWLLNALAPRLARSASLHSLRSGDLAALKSAAIVFLPERDDSGRSVTSLVRAIRAMHPGLHISVCTLEPARLSWADLARAGADDVTELRGEANAHGLELWVDERLSLPVPEHAIRELMERRGRSLGATIAAWSFRNATRARPVELIADWFGLSERSIRRRLSEAGLPQSDKLLRCGRLLHAFELERSGVKSKSRVASTVGYPTAQALWHALKTLRAETKTDARLAALGFELPALGRVIGEGQPLME